MSQTIKKLLREGLMKEKSISNVSVQDFNIKEIVDAWLSSSIETPVMLFKYEMQDDYNLTPEQKEELMHKDVDEVVEMDRFKKWIDYEAEHKIESFISDISHYFKDGIITIWRVMTVSDKWLQSLPFDVKRLGMYWSYEEDAAEAHWGRDNSHEIRIQTSVREEYVDWSQTINANIDLQIGEDEKEITLFKNTPIRLEKLSVDGKEFNVSYLKDKVFKA
jgi:hypothetical protein